MSSLVEKIVACHQALSNVDIPHAFGGALALAWCTQAARGTIDIDINVFVSPEQASTVFDGLPAEIKHKSRDLKNLIRDGQIRIWWDATPVDLFLNNTSFHQDLQTRVRWEHFAGHKLPFLSCQDLAVFKAFFNRTKDWADLEEMHLAGTLDWHTVAGVLTEYLGGDDERVAKLRTVFSTQA
jgi:hypothetical protein